MEVLSDDVKTAEPLILSTLKLSNKIWRCDHSPWKTTIEYNQNEWKVIPPPSRVSLRVRRFRLGFDRCQIVGAVKVDRESFALHFVAEIQVNLSRDFHSKYSILPDIFGSVPACQLVNQAKKQKQKDKLRTDRRTMN